MPVSPSEYREKVSNLKTLQKIVLDKFNKSSIDYKANPNSETKGEFEKQKNQLESDFYSKLFILQKNINSSISQNNALIANNDITIDSSEKIYNDKIKTLQEKRGTQLASKPFKKNMQLKMIEEYLYLGYYSLAIIAGFVFLYKH
jgi:hypothetical protein